MSSKQDSPEAGLWLCGSGLLLLPATIVRCAPDPKVNRCKGNIKVDLQMKLILQENIEMEFQANLTPSQVYCISITCISFCNLLCLTGGGGKVMGIVWLPSHQATLCEMKPNMGVQIMSSNNLGWQDCIDFSHEGTVETTSTRMSNATLGRLACNSDTPML